MIKKVCLYVCLLLVTPHPTLTQDSPDMAPLDDPELEYEDEIDPCEPDCIGEIPGTLTPDPQNCHRYYQCLEDEVASDVVFTCPNDEKFDVMTSSCSPDFGNVTCGICAPSCVFDCPTGEIVFMASRDNCSEYVLCGMGDQDPIQCPPETPFFDGVQCQTNFDLCCEPCEVFCWSAFTEVADPEDCHSFYFCSEDNYFPGEDDRYRCPDEGIFHNGRCADDDGSVVCDEPCAWL